MSLTHGFLVWLRILKFASTRGILIFVTDSNEVDDYISSYSDWRGDKLKELRQLISEAGPELTEDFKWGVPVWTYNGLIGAISAFKDHVKINFFKGIYFSDQSHFNSGLESKEHRSINFSDSDKIDATVIKKLVRAAVEHNKK